MNKNKKILTIFGLGLILFLIGGVSSTNSQITAPLTAETRIAEEISPEREREEAEILKEFYGGTKAGQLADPSDVGHQKTTQDFMLVQYIAATIGGYLVKIAAYLTNLSLELNFKILDASYNPYVTTGWSISRDLANLGFVLFIIIIALATILRYQEYAAKSTLAKLIAVALLVNFSLLGAGVFVDFSNMLTKFFIEGVRGGSTLGLATTIVESWNPGRFLETKKIEDEGGGFSITGLLTGALKAVISWIASLFFVIIFTLLMAFVLFALAIMFLIRFVALNVLLVLVPLACLFWILPVTKNLWEKWWHQFIRWVLFAPAASFFLFLAIKMTEGIKKMSEVGGGTSTLETLSEAAQNAGTANAIKIESIANAGLLPQLANGVILIGFVLGGLIVANSLSITGAKTFYGWAQTAGKGARAWTGRKGIQYGTALLRRKGTEEDAKSFAEKTQAWAAARKTGLGRYAAGWVARGTTRLATAGGEDQIKYHEKQIADMSMPDTKAALLTAFGPRKIALINKLTKANQSGNIDMTRIATEDTKKLFARFGQGIVFGNTEKAGLMSVEMNETRVKDDAKMLLEKTESLIAKFTKKDVEPAAWKDMFSGKAKFGLDEKSLKKQSQYIAKALSIKNPGLVANIIPKLDSTSRINFVEAYRDALKGVSKETSDAFEKTMANYAVGFSPTEAAAETAKT